MQNSETIKHTGTVHSIDSKYVTVNILSHPSCTGCHASGICDISGQKEKSIQALRTLDVKVGQKVMVVMERALGFRALYLGYIQPFLIVLVLLIILTSLSVSEPVAGLVSLLSLAPYYIIIFLSKEKIGKKFSFSLKKLI